MEMTHAIWLAIVQGLSEWLPVSSSGHLVLMPHFFGWRDQGLLFDVALHIGTLFAVVTYFRRELLAMASAWFRSLSGGPATSDARLAWCVIAGTVPVGVAGLAFGSWIEAMLRNPLFVAATLSFFGLLMWAADRFGPANRDEHSLGIRDAILIGCAQALALMPGTSRSGVTMTMARTLGLTREAAARFSFLLAVPGTAMAGAWEMWQAVSESRTPIDWPAMAVGSAVAALTGYLCIHFLLRVIGRVGLAPFAIYRFVLAAVIVAVFAG
jgi:undecaprenyl-diphosphatase